jgi:hypothetical protein
MDEQKVNGNRGSNHPKAKLDEAQVSCIKALLRKGKKLREVAALYGVSIHAIAHIKNGESWNHVP